ncbi:MAG TPA: sigma-54 dependent transcriptional regulator [Dehalococcoidales bacterium]|nr:sigma-54 dependent transcriptional regulator [Dehalococcoidales bacterium]
MKIVIVDDDAIFLNSLQSWLTAQGQQVFTAENSEEALELVRRETPQAAFIDLNLIGEGGLKIFKKARQIVPELLVVMMTSSGSVQSAINAIKEGAFDYIEKPVLQPMVDQIVDKMDRVLAEPSANLTVRQKIEEKYTFESIVAKSSRMQKIVEMIKVVAKSNAPVSIYGESGTGKELVARAIHSQSFRRNKPFVVVSCAAVPENMIESEMFGHETGAYPGAVSQRKGKMELASGGTLFLDEVSRLDSSFQVHLLRTLEQKAFTPVGGSEQLKSDVRLISSTNIDMKKAIEAGSFREDLYYRLSVVSIELPPLRERKEDIPILVELFLLRFNEENQRRVTGFSSDANDFLLHHDWPGNIRELENAIERAVILSKGEVIQVTDLSPQSPHSQPRPPAGKTMREIEKNHIYNVLIEAGGNCSEAARHLGISRMTLYNKIKAYGLNIHKIGTGE